MSRKKARTWLHLRASGQVYRMHDRGDMALPDMQAAVGGYIERVPLGRGATLWVNEDGRGMGLPVNEAASALLRTLAPDYAWGGLPAVVGDALVEVIE